MIVKPSTFTKLAAIDKNNKLINISNMILRKCVELDKQDSNLNDNSMCIVCNFRFLENRIDWSKKVRAVCHPFRDDSIFPNRLEKYLFSESDFCDKVLTSVDYCDKKWDKYNYDFVYFTLNTREGTRSKGIYLLPIIDEAAKLLNLKGLVIDYSIKETAKHKGTIYDVASKKIKKMISNKKFKNLQFIKKKLSSKQVCSVMLGSRFVLLPSDADASPRLLVESIVRNRPLVINSSIYGGWKYINDENGSFFDAPTIEDFVNDSYEEKHVDNMKKSFKNVLSLKDVSKISKNFYSIYGFSNSAKRLAKIINKITGKKYKAVGYREWSTQLKSIF